MNKLIILTILSFTVHISCGQSISKNPKNKTSVKENITTDTILTSQSNLDTSIIAIIPIDKANPWRVKNAKAIVLTNGDLMNIDEILKTCLTKHNSTQDSTRQFSGFIDLKKYMRQYVPFVDANGERKVYVNCFCRIDGGFNYWGKTLVRVDDGGSCFFQLIINLTQFNYKQFSTNGYG